MLFNSREMNFNSSGKLKSISKSCMYRHKARKFFWHHVVDFPLEWVSIYSRDFFRQVPSMDYLIKRCKYVFCASQKTDHAASTLYTVDSFHSFCELWRRRLCERVSKPFWIILGVWLFRWKTRWKVREEVFSSCLAVHYSFLNRMYKLRFLVTIL